MSQRLFSLLFLLGSANVGCGSTTIVHRSLTSAGGTRETASYGLGSTTNDSSSFGRQSHDEDLRVEHAADLSVDGRARFWRVALHAKDAGDVLRMEWLELCAGSPENPSDCRTAVEVVPNDKNYDVGGFLSPTLVDPSGLGRAARASKVSSSSGTFSQVSGSAGSAGATQATRRRHYCAARTRWRGRAATP